MVLEQITAMAVSSVNVVFGPMTIFPPYISLAILSIALTVIVVVLGRIVTNKKIVSEIKAKTEDLRVKLADAQKEGNKEGVNQLMTELMKTQNQYMKHSFKMMIISLVVISLFLPWAQYTYSAQSVATLPFSLPFIGSSLSWAYWYILISFSVGWIIRKLLGVE